ncbi:hypothetical protein T10_10865 [Trichinella papuae]|uniref:Uncharacterized protein n=1 Tax=Trichinella papuae TaxID=268474 RepID=A0A0V1N450_9BILA|nr:hypothetical protein T10_10865 [Trichinella papuae]
MLMHTVAASFFKISREIGNQERRGYVHCTWQIVSDGLIPILANFGSQSFSRKFRNFEIRNEERCGYVHCTWQIVSDRLIPLLPIFGSQSFPRKFRNFSFTGNSPVVVE